MIDTQNAGDGGSASPYGPQVAQAAAMLKAQQASQPAVQATSLPNDNTASIRQQMQASRAVGQNYAQQMAQAGAGGPSDYGQAAAQQHAALMQAFQGRSQAYARAYARMGQMSPQEFTRAAMLQALAEVGQDTDGMQSLWAQQDQAAAGGGQ